MKYKNLIFFLLILSSACTPSERTYRRRLSSQSCGEGAPLGFHTHIKPILKQKCIGCHNADDAKGRFRADVYIEEGSSQSPQERWVKAWRQIEIGSMPRNEDPLDDCQWTIFKTWVERGAPEVAVSDGAAPMDCSNRMRIAATSDTRRLTRTEYINALRDLVGSSVVAQLSQELAALPADSVDWGYDTQIQGASSMVVDAYFGLAEKVADIVMASSTSRQILSACMSGISTLSASAADACVSSTVTEVGKRAFRRPLKDQERVRYLSLYQALVGASQIREDAMRSVLSALLSSPLFIYKLEIEGTPVPGHERVFALSQHEIAARIAFMTQGTLPDSALLARADRGELTTDAELRSAMESRLLKTDTKARGSFLHFHRQWLLLDRTSDAAQSPAFLGSISPAGLRDDSMAEIESYLQHHLFDREGNFSTLMTDQKVFARSNNIASIYGVPRTADMNAGTETGTPLRGGLLTRVARLNDGRDDTSPVHRGVFIRRQFLCDDLPQPNPAELPVDSLVPPPYDPNKSSRERWTVKTSGPACIGCHSQINPLGFALEKYDSIGRLRDREPSGIPIDDSVDLVLDGTQSRRVVGGGAGEGLSGALAASSKANQCYAKQWLRFAHGRRESFTEDGCQIEDMKQALTQTSGSAREMFIRSATTPEFRYTRKAN